MQRPEPAPAPLALDLGHAAPPPTWQDKDAVFTPVHLASFLLDFFIPHEQVVRVIETGAGNGAWIEAIVARHLAAGGNVSGCLDIVGVDLNPNCAAGDFFGMQRRCCALDPNGGGPGRTGLDTVAYRFREGDALTMSGLRSFDLSVGNPPFSQIPAFVERSLELARYVGFLLPLDLIGGRIPRPTWLLTTPLGGYLPLIGSPWPNKLRGVGWFFWDRELSPLSERMDEPIGLPARPWS